MCFRKPIYYNYLGDDMMRFFKSIFALALSVTLVSGYSASVTLADSPQDKDISANEVVSKYIKAINEKKIESITDLVIDTRYSSQEDLQRDYKGMVNDNVYTEIEVKDISTIDDSNAIVHLVAERNDGLKATDIDLPLVKNNGDWKILITGQETSREDRVNFSEFKAQSTSEIKPFSVSIAYYEFSHTKRLSGIGYHYTAYSTSSFDMNGRSVNINGWQENPGTSSDVDVKYSIVKKNLFGDDVKGATSLSGRYPKYGAWYNTSITVDSSDSGISGVYLKTENTSSIRGASGAGNVYQI